MLRPTHGRRCQAEFPRASQSRLSVLAQRCDLQSATCLDPALPSAPDTPRQIVQASENRAFQVKSPNRAANSINQSTNFRLQDIAALHRHFLPILVSALRRNSAHETYPAASGRRDQDVFARLSDGTPGTTLPKDSGRKSLKPSSRQDRADSGDIIRAAVRSIMTVICITAGCCARDRLPGGVNVMESRGR